MPTTQFTLAGANFRPAEAKQAIKEAEIGDTVELEADPENPYDPNAVKVILEGEFVGFVPKTDNAPLAAALADGATIEGEIIAFESTLKPVIEVTLD